jgi:hypothetical protein
MQDAVICKIYVLFDVFTLRNLAVQSHVEASRAWRSRLTKALTVERHALFIATSAGSSISSDNTVCFTSMGEKPQPYAWDASYGRQG